MTRAAFRRSTSLHSPAGLVARFLLVAVAALLSVLALEPHAIAAAAFIGLALFILAIYGASGWLGGILGLTYGSLFALFGLSWVSAWGLGGWLFSTLVIALLYGAFGAAAAHIMRLAGWPLWIACSFAVLDYIIGTVDLSTIATSRISYTQAHTALFPLSALGGSALIAFVVALIAALASALVIHLAHRHGSIFWLLGLSGLVGITVLLVAALPPNASQPTAERITIMTVQPGRGSGLESFSGIRGVSDGLADSISWIRSYASQHGGDTEASPDLIVLPPRLLTAKDLELAPVRKALSGTSERAGSPILLGFSAGGEPEVGQSRFVLWGPSGPIQYLSPSLHGEGVTEDQERSGDGQEIQAELLPTFEIEGISLGLAESVLTFESPDEMPALRNVQGLIVVRPAAEALVEPITSRIHMTSTRLLAATINRPAVISSRLGPSVVVSANGEVVSWSDKGRLGYLISDLTVSPAEGLPEQRDSLLFLIFLLAPLLFLLLSLHVHTRRHRSRPAVSEPDKRL